MIGYLLSRKEGKTGGPEKPLSDLGRLSYRRYWRYTILQVLLTKSKKITLYELCEETGIAESDILDTLQLMDMITCSNDVCTLRFDRVKSQKLLEKFKLKNYPKAKMNLLKWKPSLFRQAILEEPPIVKIDENIDLYEAIDQSLELANNLLDN